MIKTKFCQENDIISIKPTFLKLFNDIILKIEFKDLDFSISSENTSEFFINHDRTILSCNVSLKDISTYSFSRAIKQIFYNNFDFTNKMSISTKDTNFTTMKTYKIHDFELYFIDEDNFILNLLFINENLSY